MTRTGGVVGRLARWPAANVVLALAVFVVGSLLGVGIFTLGYARGYSYLSNDPTACVNCHAMRDQYDAWIAGPHANVATCNDCHTPHDNILNKYFTKAETGFRHALAFTTGNYPENIRITDRDREITEEACLYCHGDLVDELHVTRPQGETISCLACHSDVGHSEGTKR
jgi:cytochrome c nitrite reductase small subunit